MNRVKLTTQTTLYTNGSAGTLLAKQLLTPERGVLTVRRFTPTDADYTAVVDIQNACFPETPETVADWQHYDRTRDAQYFYRRDLFELNGRPVAFSTVMEPHWSYRPGKYFIISNLHPADESPWLRTAVWNHMLSVVIGQAASGKEPNTLMSAAREDKLAQVAFLEERGFERQLRYPKSELEVDAFDSGRFAEAIARVQAEGITITTLQQLMQTDPDWQRKLYDMECEIDKDIPSPEPLTNDSLEVFLRKRLESPNFLPEAFFVALDGKKYVGLSALWRNSADPAILQTGLTGVLRPYRRRGIATALKVSAIGYAQARGVSRIGTENEEHNPMFQINLALGFEPQPAWLDFLKPVNREMLLEEQHAFRILT